MKILRQVLGDSYGGPSISHRNGEFVLYSWGDAPVSDDVLLINGVTPVSSKNWNEFLKLVKEYHNSLQVAPKKSKRVTK